MKQNDKKKASSFLSLSERERLRALEDFVADEYILTTENKLKGSIDSKIDSNLEKYCFFNFLNR